MKNILLYYVIPLAALLGTGVFLAYISHTWMSHRNTSAKRRINISVLILSIFLGLTIAEGVLRATGIMGTYVEKRFGFYMSPYDYNRDNVLWNRDAYQEYTLRSQEFSFPRKANSVGFIDKEFTTGKDSDEIKILCLGDSFTEGDGVPIDSSYPRQMERILQARHPSHKITVLNAGICGSDPVFGYKIYDSLMYHYAPDIVVQSVSSQDFYQDIAFRGGFERFTADGRIHFADPFPFERLYQFSFLSRIYFDRICGLSWLFLNQDILEHKLPYLKDQACLVGTKWDAQIEKRAFRVFFVLLPNKPEVREGYDLWYKDILSHLSQCSHHSSIGDLKVYYTDSVGMGKNIDKYFWKQDGHHTAAGYMEMALGTAHIIDTSSVFR